MKQNLPEPVKSPSDQKLVVKTVLIVLLVMASAASLIYVGFWYGIKSTSQIPLKQNLTPSPVITQEAGSGNNQVSEVPYGDEDLDKDEAYQKAMRETKDTSDQSKPVWVPYVNETYKFSFDFPPTKVFLEKTDGKNLPIVYLDTKLIVIPEAYDSQLTPVEIRVPPLVSYKTLEAAVAGSKDLFVASSLKETRISAPFTGVRLTGTGFIYDTPQGPYERILIQGNAGIIIIDYLPGADFPQELFDQLLATFKTL